MPRYFLEVSYKGDQYSGFQVQDNANTIQSEIERAFQIFYKLNVALTGSSRTDAGVHALQNYFHFDWPEEFMQQQIYNLNAILPPDIVIKSVRSVSNDAHCRFHAINREYKYYTYFKKNPFLADRGWFFPFQIDKGLLNQCAEILKDYHHFEAFSKRNTQVKTFICTIEESFWTMENECLVYHVKANRFLRGMVRALVSTMLQVARGNLSLQQFKNLIEARKQSAADFSAPAKGLFLVRVNYPVSTFK
jgi:tRNA pseudouridine38-40 synthase